MYFDITFSIFLSDMYPIFINYNIDDISLSAQFGEGHGGDYNQISLCVITLLTDPTTKCFNKNPEQVLFISLAGQQKCQSGLRWWKCGEETQ